MQLLICDSMMKSSGHKEWDYLAIMDENNTGRSHCILGYVKAWVVCYCKPNARFSHKKRIEDKELNFKNIAFTIDRYVGQK